MEKTIKSQSKMRFYVINNFRENYKNTFGIKHFDLDSEKCQCNGECGDACKCKSEQQAEEGD